MKCTVQRLLLLTLLCVCGLGVSTTAVRAEGLVRSKSHFYYNSGSGKVTGARIIRRSYRMPVTHASATVDPRLDPRLRRAASFAQERAHARTKARCWRYVKQALVAAGVVDSYPTSNYGAQAGDELVSKYGFKKLPIRDPYAAPVGAVIVYGKGAGGAGHVEIRTKDGFVSDYYSKNKCFYPLIAVYGKFSS
jgi:hypothetical protein